MKAYYVQKIKLNRLQQLLYDSYNSADYHKILKIHELIEEIENVTRHYNIRIPLSEIPEPAQTKIRKKVQGRIQERIKDIEEKRKKIMENKRIYDEKSIKALKRNIADEDLLYSALENILLHVIA